MAGNVPGEIDTPYFPCFLSVLHAAKNFALAHGGQKVQFIFDDNDTIDYVILRIFHLLKRSGRFNPSGVLGGISFFDDKAEVPLQASDLLAWQIRNRIDQAIRSKGSGKSPRGAPHYREIAANSWYDPNCDWVDPERLTEHARRFAGTGKIDWNAPYKRKGRKG